MPKAKRRVTAAGIVAPTKDEQTGKRVRSIAGRVLATGRYTDIEVMALAASYLNQSPDSVSAILEAADER